MGAERMLNMIDLDQVERIATAQDSLAPSTILALIRRCREAEAATQSDRTYLIGRELALQQRLQQVMTLLRAMACYCSVPQDVVCKRCEALTLISQKLPCAP